MTDLQKLSLYNSYALQPQRLSFCNLLPKNHFYKTSLGINTPPPPPPAEAVSLCRKEHL